MKFWKSMLWSFLAGVSTAIPYLLAGWLFWPDIRYAFFAVTLHHFCMGYWHISKTPKPGVAALVFLAPFSLVMLVMLLFVKGTLVHMISIPIGGILGLLGALWLVRYPARWALAMGGLFTLLYSLLLGPAVINLCLWVKTSHSIVSSLNVEKGILVSTPNGQAMDPHIFNNKIVVFDFWASYCGPCWQSMPHFNELAVRYNKNSDIVFGSINIHSDKDPEGYLKNFADTTHYAFQVFASTDSLLKQLGVQMIPHYAIFSKQGKLIYNGSIQGDFQTKMDTIISKARQNMPVAALGPLAMYSLPSQPTQ